MKKAFTLIELLAVITLLGLIALITFPSVNKSIKNSKEQSLQRTIENIETAARNYGSQYNLGYNVNYTVLELSKIKDAGFLENKAIINPVTNEELSGCVIYRWKEQDKQYEYKYIEPCSIEETVPTMTIAYDNEAINSNGWTNKNMLVNFYGNGDKYLYCVGGTECTPVIEENKPNGSKIITDEGVNVVCAKAVNDLGESDVVCTEPIKLDKTAPTIGNITFTGTMGKNSWYTTDVNINIEDGSDSLSGHASTVSSVSSVTSNTKGTMVYLVTTDLAGNSAVNAYNIKVDKDRPTIVAKDGDVEILEGTSNSSSNYFNVSYGISGGSISCNPSNTSSLDSGNQLIICSAIGGNGLSTEASKSIYVKSTSLIGLLYSQYDSGIPGTTGLKQDSNNSNLYYYSGSNSEVKYNYLWYGGHQWRVLEFDMENNTLTLITQQPLTAIQPASAVWENEEAYNNSYIKTWLNDYFLNSLDSSIQKNILDSTFNVGIDTDVDEITTTQKVGLLDGDQYKRAGEANSFLDIKNYFWLGNRINSSYVRRVNNFGYLGDDSPSDANGVRAVIKISDITITGGDGTLSDSYRTSKKATTTNDIQVGEYISVPTSGAYCGDDNLCTFRVVSKDNDSIKVVLNGLLPNTSIYGNTPTITINHDIYTSLNEFVISISDIYRCTGNKTFYIGDYPSGANYKDVQDEPLEASVGLPTVGEMFSGNDIDLSKSSTKKFVDVNTIENPTVSIYYWTMNRNSSSDVLHVRDGGFFGGSSPSITGGVRAVIYLKSGTSAITFTGGEGTPNSPYTLQ